MPTHFIDSAAHLFRLYTSRRQMLADHQRGQNVLSFVNQSSWSHLSQLVKIFWSFAGIVLRNFCLSYFASYCDIPDNPKCGSQQKGECYFPGLPLTPLYLIVLLLCLFPFRITALLHRLSQMLTIIGYTFWKCTNQVVRMVIHPSCLTHALLNWFLFCPIFSAFPILFLPLQYFLNVNKFSLFQNPRIFQNWTPTSKITRHFISELLKPLYLITCDPYSKGPFCEWSADSRLTLMVGWTGNYKKTNLVSL